MGEHVSLPHRAGRFARRANPTTPAAAATRLRGLIKDLAAGTTGASDLTGAFPSHLSDLNGGTICTTGLGGLFGSSTGTGGFDGVTGVLSNLHGDLTDRLSNLFGDLTGLS